MTKAVFLVYPSHGQWWIDLEGKASGPCKSRAAAIADAIRLAQASEQSGRPSEVLAPGDDRRHHVAWPVPTTRRHLETPLAG
jgi:hypothetical protein